MLRGHKHGTWCTHVYDALYVSALYVSALYVMTCVGSGFIRIGFQYRIIICAQATQARAAVSAYRPLSHTNHEQAARALTRGANLERNRFQFTAVALTPGFWRAEKIARDHPRSQLVLQDLADRQHRPWLRSRATRRSSPTFASLWSAFRRSVRRADP